MIFEGTMICSLGCSMACCFTFLVSGVLLYYHEASVYFFLGVTEQPSSLYTTQSIYFSSPRIMRFGKLGVGSRDVPWGPQQLPISWPYATKENNSTRYLKHTSNDLGKRFKPMYPLFFRSLLCSQLTPSGSLTPNLAPKRPFAKAVSPRSLPQVLPSRRAPGVRSFS